MNSGTDALDKNQLAIATLIYDTYYAKCGKKEIRDIINQFHAYADNVIKLLLSCNSIEQMVNTYAIALPYLNGFTYTDDTIDCIVQGINVLLRNGYTTNIDKSILSMLTDLINNENIYYGFIAYINNAIITLKSSTNITIEIADDLLDITITYEVEMEICDMTKQVNINRVYLKKVDFGKSFL